MRPLSLGLAAAVIALAPADGRAGGGEVFAPLPPDAADLDGYRWRNRPVLLFAPSADDPGYAEQRAALQAARAGLVERDIVVLSDTDPAADGALRRRLEPADFEVLLVGKDGGVKLRRQAPIPPAELFGVIDAMPMRRQEMSE
jgi:hypothetical protein